MDDTSKKRATSAERMSIVGLFHILDLLDQSTAQNERTVARAKTGLRDYRTIRTKLEKVVREVFMTIPVDQMYQIRRQLAQSYLKLTDYGAPGKQEDGLWIVSDDDLLQLINMAAAGACMLCDGYKQDCVLSRLIDEMPVTVKDTFRIACKGGI